MIPNLKFRQIKLLLKNGKWKHNKSKIFNQYQLDKFINKYKPIKCYVSNAYWLSPEVQIGKNPKGTYQVQSNIFLGSDLVFDLDRTHKKENKIYTWQDIQNDANKLLNAMDKEDNFELFGIFFSGSQGLHIRYTQKESYKEKSVFKRMETYELERKRLISRLPILRTLDKNITIDSYRITKIPNTFSNGNKVQEISRKDLECFSIISILERIEKSDEKNTITKVTSSGHPHLLGKNEAPRIPSSSKYISNTVYGVKDRVCFFALVNKKRLEWTLDVLEEYKLGNIHIFDAGTFYQLISSKAIAKRRLEKILSRIDAVNFREFKRIGWSKIRTSKIMNEKGIVSPKPKLIKTIEMEGKGQFSKAHMEYLSTINVPQQYSNSTIGVSFKNVIEEVSV